MLNYVIVLVAMTVVVAILALYRKFVARNEDDLVHLADPTGQLIANQQKVARSLQLIDRMGIAATIITAVYGVGLLAAYLYFGLNQNAGM
jgi:hypothetical protein